MSSGNDNQRLSDLLGKLGASQNLNNTFNFDGQTNADFIKSQYTPLSDRLLNNEKYLQSKYNLELPSQYDPSQRAQSGSLSINDKGYDPYKSRLDSRDIESPYSAGIKSGSRGRGTARGSKATNKGAMNAPTSLNQRIRGKGAIQTDLSGFLAGIPTNIDEETTLQGFGNANFGGREARFSGGINDNNRNIARAGIVGGNLSDRTGFVSSQDSYNFSDPLTYFEQSQNISPNSAGNISYEGMINANLKTPEDFKYTQQIDLMNAGSSGIAQSAQTQGQGSSNITENQTIPGQEQSPLTAITNPLGALSNLLFGNGTTTVVSDIAQTQAQSGLNNASSGTLTAPGDAQMSQGTSTQQQSQTTSPVFGNNSQANTSNTSQSNQNLSVGQGGGTAQASSAAQGNAQANDSIEQTQITTQGGLLPKSGDSTTLVNSNSQAQANQQLQNETAATGNASATSNNAGTSNAGTSQTNVANQGSQQAQSNTQGGEAGTVQNSIQQGGAGTSTSQNVSNSGNILSGTPLEQLGNYLLGGKTVTTQESVGAGSGTNASQTVGSTGNASSQAGTNQSSTASAQGTLLGGQVNTSTGTNLQGNTQTQGNATSQTQGSGVANADGTIDATKTVTSGGLLGRTKTREELQAEANAAAAAQSQAGLTLGANSLGQANQTSNASAVAQAAGANASVNAATSGNVQGQTQGNASLQGNANAEAQGQANTTYSQGGDESGATTSVSGGVNSNSQLIATLQGQGANVQGQAQAQAALSGSMGAAAKTQVEIQAKRFITDLEKALPNDEIAQAAIARMKQDPSLVWLFDGSNSPKSVITAIANSASNITLSSSWATGGDVARTVAEGTAGNIVTIDPNNPTSNGAIRYYQDPQTGKTFANVQGEVREVKQGQLVPIDFTDKVTINAKSRAEGLGQELATTNLDIDGNIKGRQYYYSGGGDSIYDQLANEIIARSNNTFIPTSNSSPSELFSTLNNLRSKNITAEDLSAINNYIAQEQQRRQELANFGRTDNLDTLVDYNDFFEDPTNSALAQKYGDIYKNYGYDERGNVLFQGNSLSKYNDLLDAYDREYNFDKKYGYDLGGNMLDLNSVKASGTANNLLHQAGYIPGGGQFLGNRVTNDANLKINGIDMSENPNRYVNGQLISPLQNLQHTNPYQKLTFETSNRGVAESNTNILNQPHNMAVLSRMWDANERAHRAWLQTDRAFGGIHIGYHNTPGIHANNPIYNTPNVVAFNQTL